MLDSNTRVKTNVCFTNRWRHRELVVSSRWEGCRRRACRVAPVRRRPPPKPTRSRSCDKHQSGTTNGPGRRTPRPAPRCSGRPTLSSVRRYHCARTSPGHQCWRCGRISRSKHDRWEVPCQPNRGRPADALACAGHDCNRLVHFHSLNKWWWLCGPMTVSLLQRQWWLPGPFPARWAKVYGQRQTNESWPAFALPWNVGSWD